MLRTKFDGFFDAQCSFRTLTKICSTQNRLSDVAASHSLWRSACCSRYVPRAGSALMRSSAPAPAPAARGSAAQPPQPSAAPPSPCPGARQLPALACWPGATSGAKLVAAFSRASARTCILRICKVQAFF